MPKKAGKPKNTLQIPATIVLTGKVLQFISPKLAMRFAAKIFTTPFKHKIPRRELDMNSNSKQIKRHIDSIDKEVVAYFYGNSSKKVLLVHGWSGRGTQLFKFADELLQAGYSTVSFDAPAHGKSSGKTTVMPEFVSTIQQLSDEFGPFEGAIGHSLGGMALLNAAKRGFKTKAIVTIGSGNVIQDVIDEFTDKMKLDRKIGRLMSVEFEKMAGEPMYDYSSYIAAQTIDFPVMIVHDEKDHEVPVEAAKQIIPHLKHGKLLLTSGLGHRKILGHHEVIEKSINFLKNNS